MATPDETAAALEKAKTELLAAETAHADALANADQNKTPEEQVLDLLEGVVMRLGNRPELRTLLDRLRRRIAALTPAAPEDPAPASTSSETKAA